MADSVWLTLFVGSWCKMTKKKKKKNATSLERPYKFKLSGLLFYIFRTKSTDFGFSMSVPTFMTFFFFFFFFFCFIYFISLIFVSSTLRYGTCANRDQSALFEMFEIFANTDHKGIGYNIVPNLTLAFLIQDIHLGGHLSSPADR